MKLANLPSEDALSLLRSLGLLVGQAGIYGPAHNVTQQAARIAFPALEQMVTRQGAIEITLRDKQLLVNGSAMDVGGSSGKNLLDRMTLHKVEGIAFLPPANLDEFLQCVTLFGTPPAALAASGGFENAMKQAGLRSVQVVNVTYRRVARDAADAAARTPPAATDRQRLLLRQHRPGATMAASGVLDLAPLTEDDTTLTNDVAGSAGAPAAHARHPSAAIRQQRTSALAGLLRQAATVLEQANAGDAENQHAVIEGTVSQIREMLTSMTTDSEHQIQTFAGQVNADRLAIADIESAARRRGVGLQLTRNDLITRYAEISQEIAQPLTVSTGVLDLLNSGRAGDLSESQRDLLKMAAESVERVNRLVAHLKQISGMPESLTPDASILKDAYGGAGKSTAE